MIDKDINDEFVFTTKAPSEMRGRERGTVYRSGGSSGRRPYRSTRNERRRRSRSRSRDRNHKRLTFNHF
jgi:hypothetical protein